MKVADNYFKACTKQHAYLTEVRTTTQSVKLNPSTATVYDPITLLKRKVAQTFPDIKFYIGSSKISACHFLPPTGMMPSA